MWEVAVCDCGSLYWRSNLPEMWGGECIYELAQTLRVEGCGMKVEKEKFDALLHRMMKTPPEPKKAIKIEGKAGKIIPAIRPESEPRKA